LAVLGFLLISLLAHSIVPSVRNFFLRKSKFVIIQDPAGAYLALMEKLKKNYQSARHCDART
jgi:hypothetical protein